MAVLVITGASGELGRSLRSAAIAEGWHVVGVDRDDVDLADAAATSVFVETIGGPIAGVAHLVGGIEAGADHVSTPPDVFERMWRMNVVTTANVLRAVVPRLRQAGGGSIVTIGAQSVLHPVPNRAAYATSKAAVAALTLAIAEEERPNGIRANCLLPSILRTAPNLEWATDGAEDRWVSLDAASASILACLDPRSAMSGALIPLPGALPF